MNLNELVLTHTRGLPAQAALYLANQPGLPDLDTADERERCLRELRQRGYVTGIVQWANRDDLDLINQHLERLNIRLCWHGRSGYPFKLYERLGEDAPAWLWVSGDESRLEPPACAMIGSRQSPPPFLSTARRLATELSARGITLASGGARGADTAAHEGARQGRAGIIVIPAHGILTMNLDDCQPGANHMTCLGLDQAQAPFHAGRAIRRNDIIAALSDALVLVASDIKGGSAYAVRWALAHRLPVWCFSDDEETPPGNEMLIRQGLAQPLPIRQPVGILAEAIAQSMREHQKQQAPPEGMAPAQPNLFDDAQET